MPDVAVVVPCRDGAAGLRGLLQALLAQRLPPDWRLRVTVVDDGSTDDPASVVAQSDREVISVVRNPSPQGRSLARNRGAEAAAGALIIFVDVDCLPVGKEWLASHIAAFHAGAEVSVGPVHPAGDGFWGRYLELVAARRDAAGRSCDFASFTSANLGFSRHAWRALGGFDERYTHYGFEDRDVLARALDAGLRFRYLVDAVVLTSLPGSVADLAAKSEVAGRWSAPLFRSRHPKRYQQMPFWLFDARVGPAVVRRLSKPLAILASPSIALAERLVSMARLPFRLRLAVVRLAVGLAYLRGTLSPTD